MKISKGPMLEQYALLIGENIETVVEWVNNYVNHPGEITTQEATEKERLESIKEYITREIENSVTHRIKSQQRLKEAA